MRTTLKNVGMMDGIEVEAFNRLMREYVRHADNKYSFFSDVIYDAGLIAREFISMGAGDMVPCRWYVRDMGTYFRARADSVDHSVPCHAVFLLELRRLDYGTPSIEMLEIQGPFNRIPPTKGNIQ